VTLRYLLDTNVVSEPARPRPHRRLMARMRKAGRAAAIAAPVWHELVYGCRRLPPSPRRQALERYLKDVVAPALPVLPYDQEAAAWHARERARLEAEGKTPAFVDGQIAAVAAVRALVLVTRNLADYADFDGLVLDDWAS
jgi:tRNA(fMet)-specific endonuclease VapC